MLQIGLRKAVNYVLLVLLVVPNLKHVHHALLDRMLQIRLLLHVPYVPKVAILQEVHQYAKAVFLESMLNKLV